jgi:tetratricopeptide (TPR) repeat protein
VRGNAEEPLADGRGQRGRAGSVAFYRQALALSPRHPAAHHYLVHSYETLGSTAVALRHGQVFAELAPRVPHAHHMYGHDLARAGRTEEAIARFLRTDTLENAYYRAENIPSNYDWHHEHNIDLLALAYQHQGKLAHAERLLRRAFEIPPLLEFLEFNKRAWPSYLLARRRPDDALAAAAVLVAGKWPSTRAVGHTMSGQAHLQRGRLADAQASLEAAEKELAAVPATAGNLLPTQAAVAPYLEHLRGELSLRVGRAAEGRASLLAFARKIRGLPGPDAWSLGSFRLEQVAAVARELGDWDLARSIATQMVEHDPGYAGAHYALGLCAEQRGALVEARRELSLAARLWRGADADLPELKDLRRRRAPTSTDFTTDRGSRGTTRARP